MKKYVLVLNVIIFQLSLSAQTEYIDIAKASMLDTSTMAIYNDDKNLSDLKVYKLNIFDKKNIYHWVKYTNLLHDKVILTLSDNIGDKRQVCVKHGTKDHTCNTYDSFATSYEFKSDSAIFQIWVSRPNLKEF